MSREPETAADIWQHQRCAYQLAKRSMAAILDEDLAEVGVDICRAAALVLRSLPRIVGLRATVASSLADFDMRAIDRLEVHTRAMCYANWFYQSTHVSVGRLEDWLEQLPLLRQRIIGEASRAFPGGEFREFGNSPCPCGLRSHMELGKFLRLCCLLRLSPARVERATNLLACEIAHAELLTDLFDMADEQGGDLSAVQSIAKMNRQRSYTLFLRSYDQVRRAVQFVRWNNGDAEDIAPALSRSSSRLRQDSWLPASAKFPIAALDGTALPRRTSTQRSAC